MPTARYRQPAKYHPITNKTVAFLNPVSALLQYASFETCCKSTGGQLTLKPTLIRPDQDLAAASLNIKAFRCKTNTTVQLTAEIPPNNYHIRSTNRQCCSAFHQPQTSFPLRHTENQYSHPRPSKPFHTRPTTLHRQWTKYCLITNTSIRPFRVGRRIGTGLEVS